MTSVAKRLEVRKQVRKSSLTFQILLMFGLVGVLVSLFVASRGIDLSPGFF